MWLAIFYFPIVIRLLCFWGSDNLVIFRTLNRWVGRAELYFGWLRDLGVFVWVGILIWQSYQGYRHFGYTFSVPFETALLIPAIGSRWWRWRGLAPLQDLARRSPKIHPTEFFDHLYARLGFLPHPIPRHAVRTVDPTHLDFRAKKRGETSFWILLHGVYDTYFFSRLIYKAFAWKGKDYLKLAGSGLALVWSSRMVQLGRMEVILERSPGYQSLGEGKKIYAINHKSCFDFCLAPFVYFRENADGSAANFIPAALVAKDHFKDNPFLYWVIGLGRVLEAWGMIFVDRKAKVQNRTEQMVTHTVKKLLASDMNLSIYPQGKRAHGQLDREGNRWDAAYFCVGKDVRLKQEDGYFKKGIAYIAYETALSLLKHRLGGSVWIIPVAMNGTGTACPVGSWKVQTETTVTIKVGDPLEIRPTEVESFQSLSYKQANERPEYRQKVVSLANRIDGNLQLLLGVPKRLKTRYLQDLREIMNGQGTEEVAAVIKQFNQNGTRNETLVYSILDCIYALPPKYWRGLLVELSNELRANAVPAELQKIKEKIAELF